MTFNAAEIIKKKKLGHANTPDEIQWLIRELTLGSVADYQITAWAMAVWFRGMSAKEIAALTLAMRDSGDRFNFSHLKAPRIDKHSTGGVGDKTTLVVGPILAAAKVFVPMIAGRGLGHTGGTLDKLDSIPGFRTQLSKSEFEKNVREHFFSLTGQTANICPADRKFYALRDVTSTIDSLPLICGSIMSKKLAEDLTGLILDVKFGSGAFMKTLDEAVALAALLKSTGELNGIEVHAVISNMSEPLGRFIGNSVEVQECCEILAGKKFIENAIDFYEPTRELSLILAAHMLFLAKKSDSIALAYVLAQELLDSGAAWEAFQRLLEYQGPAALDQLPKARFHHDVCVLQAGYITKMDTEQIGLSSVELGAGRKTAADTIDPTAGIEICVRIGQKVKAGDKLFKIFGNSNNHFTHVAAVLSQSVEINAAPPAAPLPIVAKTLI